MSSEKSAEETPHFEVEFLLPRILPGPIQLSDGTELAVGDSIEHGEFGKGKIVRLLEYEDVGLCVYADFESGIDKILGVSFVKKVS